MNIVVLIIAILSFYLLGRRLSDRRAPLPPGPRPLPIIGNLLDLPKSYAWVQLAKYKKLYGPVSSLSVMGQTIVFLNDQKSSIELLEKRGTLYADRIASPFIRLSGWGHVTTQIGYGPDLTRRRKDLHQFIGSPSAMAQLHPIEEAEARRHVLRLFRKPDDLQAHVRLLAAAVITKVSHGYTVETEKLDPMVEIADRASTSFALAAQTGKFLVDIFPFLQHFPDWMPGTNYRKHAEFGKKCASDLVETSHQFVKQQMAAGTALRSLDSFYMEKNPTPDEEFFIKWSAASLYAAGADTSVSAVYSFYIAMQLCPDAQRKAQAELDAVIGSDRLPKFSDRSSLPYVNAVVKEVLRWNAVLPLCVPHVTMEEDIYMGYRIPKGSKVISNIWAINHDSDNFKDPYTFNPDRFLSQEGSKPEIDPLNVSFGYGRRICPGKSLADATLFISVATTLAVLNIGKGVDKYGREIEPKYEMTDTLICHPKSFFCTITPRSDKAKDLMLAVEEEDFDSRSDAAVFSSIYVTH